MTVIWRAGCTGSSLERLIPARQAALLFYKKFIKYTDKFIEEANMLCYNKARQTDEGRIAG